MHGIAGSLRARAGAIEVSWDAVGPAAVSPNPLPRTGYSPQHSALPRWLKVEQAAALFGLDSGALQATLPELLLEELRGKRVGSLSTGQRQALSVAIALAVGAPLTMLDEPFASIDFRRRVGLIQVLRRRAGKGLVLIASQNAADLLDTCSWMVVLREGRYVFSGPIDELTGGGGDGSKVRRLEANVLALLGVTHELR
jgi:ABC-2 type transport system ATP-binding protein